MPRFFGLPAVEGAATGARSRPAPTGSSDSTPQRRRECREYFWKGQGRGEGILKWVSIRGPEKYQAADLDPRKWRGSESLESCGFARKNADLLVTFDLAVAEG